MRALDANADIGSSPELTHIQRLIRAHGIILAVWSSDFDADIGIDFDAGIEIEFDVGIEIEFDAGIEIDFDAGIEIDFDAGIEIPPELTDADIGELTDADNRSEHTGSFFKMSPDTWRQI